MSTLQEYLDHQVDHITGEESGLDMYGLSGYVDIFEDLGEYDPPTVGVGLNIYPAYTNFFTEEDLNSVNMSRIEMHYDATDAGEEWENSALTVHESFHPGTTVADALGALFDKAQPLIHDLVSGKFEEVVRKAMEG